MVIGDTPYPLRFSVDYPGPDRNRLTTLLRLIWVIPIAIIFALLGSQTVTVDAAGQNATRTAAPFIIALPTLLMILFRQKYPRWWFDWNVALLRFENRIGSYLLLLRDEYPSTDEEQAVHLEVDYPDVAGDLNRWLPLVKWLLALPHYIVLAFLAAAAVVVTVIAWLAILLTGSYPQALFDFVVCVMRWANRVTAYAFLLVTDRYPPFSLQE